MKFEEWYMELKNDGKTDREIAEHLEVCVSTLKRMKNIYGIVQPKRVRRNQQGLTQEELHTADENGITRRLALRRVREYDWKNNDAIHIPKGGSVGKLRKGKRA